MKHKRRPASSNCSSAYPTCVCTPDSFLYRARNINASWWTPFVVGFTPTRSPYSATGIFPSQSPLFTAPLMGQTTRKQPWTQLCCRNFSYLEAKSLQVPLMGLPPTWKRHKPTNSLPRQTNHTDDKDQHSEEAWSYKFQKANGKTNQTRSKQIFSFQRSLYFFFLTIFPSWIHSFNTYLITSNKTNTKLYYTFVFRFFEKKYR